MLGSITEWEVANLKLGINLGLGGRAINAGNQEMLRDNLSTHSWNPQHAIILITSEVEGEAYIVDGNHRVSALMRMTPAEQRLVLDGTTVKCVVYEGVPANLIAILALHVNDEGLKGSATTNWHKLRFGFKAYLYLAGMKVEKVTLEALTKAVTWSDSSSSTTLSHHDISLIFRLGDRFGTAGVSKFMETFTAIEDDYPPAVRKTICDVLGTFTSPALHWKIPDKDRY
jgi:hypothetical protein